MPIKKGRKRKNNETDSFVNDLKKSNMKETFKSNKTQKQAIRNEKDTKVPLKSKPVRNTAKFVDKKQNRKTPKIGSKKTNGRSKISKNRHEKSEHA